MIYKPAPLTDPKGLPEYLARELQRISAALNARAPVCKVAALPTPAAVNDRALVTDSSVTLTAGIGAVVAGSGANVVPVYYDGSAWRIGG